MKRIPYSARDLGRLQRIAQKLFAHVEHADNNTLDNLLATASGYQDYHDLRTQAAEFIPPAAKSCSRGEIQLRLALGIRQATGLPLVPAFGQAGRAKLRGLSIDSATVERADEEFNRNHPSGKALEGLTSRSTRERREELRAAGAPRFQLAVRHDATAFHMDACVALYAAILHAKDFSLLGEPEFSDCQTEDVARARFVREVLIPSSWRPVIDLLRDGLEVANHRAIYLFADDGEYIGRAIQHTVHDGIIPKLFYTDEEVLAGFADLLTGRALFRETGRDKQTLGPVEGDAPVFTLKSGAVQPNAISDIHKTIRVPVEHLELVPGLKGGCIEVFPVGYRNWSITGDTMRYTDEDFRNTSFSYIETKPWLTEQDFPRLFPDYVLPVETDARKYWINFHRKLLLSKANKDFQDRCERVLRLRVSEAQDRLKAGAETGELLEKILRGPGAVAMEALAESHFHSDYLVDPQNVESESERIDEQARYNHRKQEHIKQLDSIVETLADRLPELRSFGKYSLWFAATALFGQVDDIDADEISYSEVLSQLALLASFTIAGKPEHVRDQMTDIAVSLWLDDQCALDELASVAIEFDEYHGLLEKQHRRLQAVMECIASELDRRELARNLGYLYVSDSALESSKPWSKKKQNLMFHRIHLGREE